MVRLVQRLTGNSRSGNSPSPLFEMLLLAATTLAEVVKL
jgi:hypothetical protein